MSRWLIDLGREVPAAVRARMMASIYGSLSIYVGGVLNTILVAVVLALRVGAPLFYVWAAFEVVMAGLRMAVLVKCRRAVRARSDAPVDLYILLSLLWGAGIGFGSYVAVSSGDWIAALIACVSSAAMLGGLSFRYFAAPRLACAMLAVASVPGAVACLMTGEPTLLIVAVQIPLYVFAMTRASFWMNRIMVKALCAESENAHRARHDVLTDLLNRRGLEEAFAALPPDEPVACFFMDLDGFKQVNDTLGHAAGDELLAMVAQRLRAAAAADDIVARIGGDEFLMIARMGDADGALIRGEGLISALAGLPYLIGGQGALIGVSVGAALRPSHGSALERLLAAADEALYEAKSGQRNRCVLAGRKPAPAEEFVPDLRLAIGAPY